MSTLATPTGFLLGEFTPGTAAWEEARAGLTITATEIAAVMGLSPWQSRFSLWHKKAGLSTAPFEANPAVEWGVRLEDAVARKWEENREGHIAIATGTWQHRDRMWQRATPDRLVYLTDTDEDIDEADPAVLLEVKTSPFGDGWGPAGSDEIPLHYQCQIQWQLDTLGLQTCHVALLVGGYDYREYVVEYDKSDARMMRDAAKEFLSDVRNGHRPPIDGADATYQTIRVQHEGREDVDVEISDQMAADYEVAQLGYKAAESELTRARGHVLDAIGTGYRAVHDGRRIAYRTVREDGTTLALQPYRSH